MTFTRPKPAERASLLARVVAAVIVAFTCVAIFAFGLLSMYRLGVAGLIAGWFLAVVFGPLLGAHLACVLLPRDGQRLSVTFIAAGGWLGSATAYWLPMTLGHPSKLRGDYTIPALYVLAWFVGALLGTTVPRARED